MFSDRNWPLCDLLAHLRSKDSATKTASWVYLLLARWLAVQNIFIVWIFLHQQVGVVWSGWEVFYCNTRLILITASCCLSKVNNHFSHGTREQESSVGYVKLRWLLIGFMKIFLQSHTTFVPLIIWLFCFENISQFNHLFHKTCDMFG